MDVKAINASNFDNYTVPSKATLQTTLVGMREKKALKTKGSRPNTKYIAKWYIHRSIISRNGLISIPAKGVLWLKKY